MNITRIFRPRIRVSFSSLVIQIMKIVKLAVNQEQQKHRKTQKQREERGREDDRDKERKNKNEGKGKDRKGEKNEI